MPDIGDYKIERITETWGASEFKYFKPPASGPFVFGVTAAGDDVCWGEATNSSPGLMSASQCSKVGAMPSWSGTTSQYIRGDGSLATLNSSSVGLSNVDNTSDANKPVSSAVSTALAGKFNTPTGTTSQYVRGDGTLATLPTGGSGTVTSVGISSSDLTVSGSPVTASGSITLSLPSTGTAGTYGRVTTDAKGRVTAGKRQETYSGTTDGSGNYTVAFVTAYSVAPNIQCSLNAGTNTQTWKVTSITTTGFTIQVVNRVDVVGLLPTYNNVSGAALDVLITEK